MTAATAHHVLVVSDDTRIDCQLQSAFAHTAPNCRLGVVRSRKEIESLQPPELIILDLMLSSERPFDLLRWLRNEPRYTQVPIFVLGSKVVAHEIDEAYSLGANSCLLKDSETNGFEKIVGALATYVGLIRHPAYPSFA